MLARHDLSGRRKRRQWAVIMIPGHALHKKGLQRQKGVVPLVSSGEERALLVPLINRGSTGDFVPPSVYIGFRLFVLLERRSSDVSSMPWRVRWTFVSWANNSVGTQSCPTPPGRSAVRPDPTQPLYVRVLDSTKKAQSVMHGAFLTNDQARVRRWPYHKFPDMPCMNLSNPKPGHTTSGSGRGARRSGRAGSGKIGCQQNYSPRKQRSTVPSKASKKRRFNVFPEARTSEILCKQTEEQNQRLTTGLSPVYQRDEKRSLFLAADQWYDAFLSL